LPETLDETYARILTGIGQEYREDAIRILQFLTFSERPLTVKEAVDVLVVDLTGDPQFDPELRLPIPREILKICSSLVSLVTKQVDNYDECEDSDEEDEEDEEDGKDEGDDEDEEDEEVKVLENGQDEQDDEDDEVKILQLAHFSIKEYLTSGRLEEPFKKSFIERSARGFMTRVCLAYLSHLDEQCSIEEIRAEFPLAQYSARYWMDHARPGETEKDVQECILKFLLQQRQAYAIWGKLFNPDQP